MISFGKNRICVELGAQQQHGLSGKQRVAVLRRCGRVPRPFGTATHSSSRELGAHFDDSRSSMDSAAARHSSERQSACDIFFARASVPPRSRSWCRAAAHHRKSFVVPRAEAWRERVPVACARNFGRPAKRCSKTLALQWNFPGRPFTARHGLPRGGMEPVLWNANELRAGAERAIVQCGVGGTADEEDQRARAAVPGAPQTSLAARRRARAMRT